MHDFITASVTYAFHMLSQTGALGPKIRLALEIYVQSLVCLHLLAGAADVANEAGDGRPPT